MNLTPNGNNNIDDYYENLIENMKHKNCSICPPISRYFIFYFSMGYYSGLRINIMVSIVVLFTCCLLQYILWFLCRVLLLTTHIPLFVYISILWDRMPHFIDTLPIYFCVVCVFSKVLTYLYIISQVINNNWHYIYIDDHTLLLIYINITTINITHYYYVGIVIIKNTNSEHSACFIHLLTLTSCLLPIWSYDYYDLYVIILVCGYSMLLYY